VVNNVSSALGAAFAGVVAVSLLTVVLSSSLSRSGLPAEFNLDNFDRVDFITNVQLTSTLADTSATAEQIAEVVRINEDARVRALKASFLLLALICLLAIFPAMRLPRHTRGALDVKEILDEETYQKKPVADAI